VSCRPSGDERKSDSLPASKTGEGARIAPRFTTGEGTSRSGEFKIYDDVFLLLLIGDFLGCSCEVSVDRLRFLDTGGESRSEDISLELRCSSKS